MPGSKSGAYKFNEHIERVDFFVIASSRRLVTLDRRLNPDKPFVCCIYIKGASDEGYDTLLSYAEYHSLEAARRDFEIRRPKMRDASLEVFEMPMQKGKRLVQEVMKEKLG